jgi:hypothetical protein
LQIRGVEVGHRGVHVLRQGRGEAVEERLHGRGADFGHYEGKGVVGAGADGAV